ncbi:hypothetical protein LCGC14_2645990 [marine sediment metagenome]|uniref:Uncharacterized protein n=1 Tax=marine sediment metagenome TaxID=412755 RepID=A0A0F8ZW56_9ZZZZ
MKKIFHEEHEFERLYKMKNVLLESGSEHLPEPHMYF